MSVYRKSYKARGSGEKKKTSNYYVEIRDHAGKVRVIPGYVDLRATRRLEDNLRELIDARCVHMTPSLALRDWIERLDVAMQDRLRKYGILSAAEVAGLRPIAALIEEWKAELISANASPRHVATTATAAARVLKGSGVQTWSGIDPAKVSAYLRSEREKPDRARTKDAPAQRPIGARTSNSLLAATAQFCLWAVRKGIARENPLRGLVPLNVEEDRRRIRRALTIEEVRLLLAMTARSTDVFDRVTAPVRALLYRMAIETGLRRGELLALKVADLDLADLANAIVVAPAKTTKNGREARLPLRRGLAGALLAHVASRRRWEPLFGIHPHWRASEALAADLAAAGISYIDEDGRVADFHALRTTFGTTLARRGVSLVMAQRLMRHSDPALTANVYTVLGKDDERRAIDLLPDFDVAAASLRATGTSGEALPVDLQASRGQEPERAGTVLDEVEAPYGGDEGSRTPDLLIANETLSSLDPESLPEKRQGTALRSDAKVMQTYFIAAVGKGFFKVGKSADPERRLGDIQVGCPLECKLVAAIDGDHEHRVHSAIGRGSRARGEWFRYSSDAYAALVELGFAEIARGLMDACDWHPRAEDPHALPNELRDLWPRLDDEGRSEVLRRVRELAK